MTHPSVNSIVESANTDRELWRGPDEGNGSYYADSIHVTASGGIGIDVGGMVYVKPLRDWHRSATIISELQAERDKWKSERNRIKAFLSEGSWETIESEQAWKARALTAESSLSRIKAETIEECARIAEQTGNFGDYRRDELTADYGQPRFDMMNAIASAIRSLDKNCSGKTDAERGSTQKEGSR